jgi:hypothetical protein
MRRGTFILRKTSLTNRNTERVDTRMDPEALLVREQRLLVGYVVDVFAYFKK